MLGRNGAQEGTVHRVRRIGQCFPAVTAFTDGGGYAARAGAVSELRPASGGATPASILPETSSLVGESGPRWC